MKLLIENFRRFINEGMFGGEGMSEGGYSEEEAAYFKDLPQIANQISNAGRQSHRYHNLFPLSAISHKDYRWVALEKVQGFQSFDVGKFNSFFPNPLLDQIKNAAIKSKMIQLSFVFNSGNKIRAVQLYKEYKKNLANVQADQIKKIGFKNICNGFAENPLYDKVLLTIQKLGIRPEEIRLANTGVGMDDRFVILDSSIDQQIISGFQKSQQVKNTPSDTQKL